MKKLLLLLLTTISLHSQNERTIYYFHGGGTSSSWPTQGAIDLLSGPSFYTGGPGGDFAGGVGTFTADVSGNATLEDSLNYMVSFVDPNTSEGDIPKIDYNNAPGYEGTIIDFKIMSYEMPIGRTIQGNGDSETMIQFNFPSHMLGSGTAGTYYWMLVPDNADFPEDLTSSNNYLYDLATSFPTRAQGKSTSITINGEDYILYRLAGPATGEATIAFNFALQTASTKDYFDSITIYPNPTSSIINIEQDFNSAKVYDISGRELLKTTSKTIDLSELPSSIYLLRLYDNSNKVLGTSKVVKQ